MKATLLPDLSGRPAIHRTIGAMEQLVRRYRRDPVIVQTARAIMRKYNVPRDDHRAEARAIYDFLSRHIRYTKDPVGVELIQDPRLTLTWRTGDCDDISVLAASLAESIGLPARFVLYSKEGAVLPHHVFTQVQAAPGEWTALDTVWDHGPGEIPPGTLELGDARGGDSMLGQTATTEETKAPSFKESLKQTFANAFTTGLSALADLGIAKLRQKTSQYETNAEMVRAAAPAPAPATGLSKALPYILIGGGAAVLVLALALRR